MSDGRLEELKKTQKTVCDGDESVIETKHVWQLVCVKWPETGINSSPEG